MQPKKHPRRNHRHLLVRTVARGISIEIAHCANIIAKAVIRWGTVMSSAKRHQLLKAALWCQDHPGSVSANDERNALRHSGYAGYLDDSIIMGPSPTEFQHRMCAVIESVLEYGFHLRSDECQFFLESIK
ncbi:unnamed protein product [Schistocephalus solidus]|uniref:Reverse transcriptase domain-containing protein n=1 Tax=Schistocephalus solidus TaxID=70667 RepID=A0A183T2H7_SCHSO|nr:unnamed protein product [Schistocephalus solidus]